MTRSVISILLLFIPFATLAQESSGTIEGTVRDPDGTVTGATVEARNLLSDAVYEATSNDEGFTLSGLPAGTYVVSVPRLGWRTLRYVREDVPVAAGETLRLDIELERDNLGVVGDDAAFLAILNGIGDVTGPTPRTSQGRPDLSGVWQGNFPPDPGTPAALPWARELAQERKAKFGVDSPGAACMPNPVTIVPTLYKFVQTPSLLVELFEYQPGHRQVFLDGRSHPEDLDPTWTGHSIGTWEGDTLVVETRGFNDLSWLPEMYPHTQQLRVVERYTRTDLGHMNVDVTFEDPGTFSEPWNLKMVWQLAPGEELMEYLCNENNQYLRNIGAQ